MIGVNGLKNVSFGELYTVNQRGRITGKQIEIEDTVNDVFETRLKKNGVETDSKNPRTLSEMLAEDMAMDVQLTHKKNGNVSLQLTDAEGIWSSEASKVVKPEDKIRIVLTKDMSPSKVRRLLTGFADKCRKLAKHYDIAIPNLLAEKHSNDEIDLRKRNAKRDAELAKLREEERFVEEFGTDRFN